MSAAVSVSPSTIMTTLCCLVLNSQGLPTQHSAIQTPGRAGPTSDPVEPKLLLQITPGKVKPNLISINYAITIVANVYDHSHCTCHTCGICNNHHNNTRGCAAKE